MSDAECSKQHVLKGRYLRVTSESSAKQDALCVKKLFEQSQAVLVQVTQDNAAHVRTNRLFVLSAAAAAQPRILCLFSRRESNLLC